MTTYYTLRRHKGLFWVAYLDPITLKTQTRTARYDTPGKACEKFARSRKGETCYLSPREFSRKEREISHEQAVQARREEGEPGCKCQHYDALSCSAITNDTTRFWASVAHGSCRCICHQDANGNQIEQKYWHPLAAKRARRAG